MAELCKARNTSQIFRLIGTDALDSAEYILLSNDTKNSVKELGLAEKSQFFQRVFKIPYSAH